MARKAKKMAGENPDPVVVSWIIYDDNGKEQEVNVFQFIAEELGWSTRMWNKYGLGGIVFKEGKLRIGPEHTTHDYRANAYTINIDELRIVGALNPLDLERGLLLAQHLMGDPDKRAEILRKAYRDMIDGLRRYLESRKPSGLQIPSIGSAAKTGGKTKRRGGKAKKTKAWFHYPIMSPRNYRSRWERLMYGIVLKKDPKVVEGGIVHSFSLNDLLSIEVDSKSPLRSVFMMEEFGTGLYADQNLRRPYAGNSTRFKVPPEIAALGGFPPAIYMWFPFVNFLVKAKLLLLAKQKLGSARAKKIIKETREQYHRKKGSLNDFRDFAYDRIAQYKAEREGLKFNPLDLAYGSIGAKTRPTGGTAKVGHPGTPARHLFFDRGGLVEGARLVQAYGMYRILFYLDQEIGKSGIKFPSLADLAFPQPPKL